MTRRQPRVVPRLIPAAWLLLWLPGGLLAADLTATPGEPLQPLIERAAGGARLILPVGRYPGPLVIDRTLTLSGEAGAVIDGGGEGHAVVLDAPDIVIETSGAFSHAPRRHFHLTTKVQCGVTSLFSRVTSTTKFITINGEDTENRLKMHRRRHPY